MKFKQSLAIEVLVQNKENIWEDSINHMLYDIVNELTQTQNYSRETTKEYLAISESFNRKTLFSKLQDNLKTLRSQVGLDENPIKAMKKVVLQASNFRTLNENFFVSSEALVFAQLNTELPYVKKSYLNNKFCALVHCDFPNRLTGFLEHLIW